MKLQSNQNSHTLLMSIQNGIDTVYNFAVSYKVKHPLIIHQFYSQRKLMFFFFLKKLDFIFFIFFLFVVNFVIHWNETAMGLHVFPIPIPPPTSLSTHSL